MGLYGVSLGAVGRILYFLSLTPYYLRHIFPSRISFFFPRFLWAPLGGRGKEKARRKEAEDKIGP